jgi:hypothetical protein
MDLFDIITIVLGIFAVIVIRSLRVALHRERASNTVLAAKLEARTHVLDLIDDLRQREGWMVELVCDNPDFNNGPNNIVDVFGEWRNLNGDWEWTTRRFKGESMGECLSAARAERDAQYARINAVEGMLHDSLR